MDTVLRSLLSLLFLSIIHISEASGTTMTLYNKCSHPVWPGIQPSAGKPVLARGGLRLPPGKVYKLRLPAGWSGRVWGRHGCAFDADGRGRCATGDCGGALFCNGVGGTPPATLAEITLGNEQDFYDVSLVDGYNLAISITPFRGSVFAGRRTERRPMPCEPNRGRLHTILAPSVGNTFKKPSKTIVMVNETPKKLEHTFEDAWTTPHSLRAGPSSSFSGLFQTPMTLMSNFVGIKRSPSAP